MNRKLKALGLAFATSLAISALTVTGAMAAQFHAAEAHTLLHGTQSSTHTYTAGEGFGGITCSTATFAGTSTSATETEETVTPSYSGCKDSFGRTAHINMNGCKYRGHATAGSGSTYTGNIDIVGCSGGKPIEITITPGGILGECKDTISEQNNIGPIEFHNVANGDVKVDSSANNVGNTTAGGLFNCGVPNGFHSNGTYNGDAVFVGSDTAGNPVNIFVG